MEAFIYLYPCLIKACNLQMIRMNNSMSCLSNSFKELGDSFKIMQSINEDM